MLTFAEEPNENDNATAPIESEDTDEIKEGMASSAYVDLRDHLQLYGNSRYWDLFADFNVFFRLGSLFFTFSYLEFTAQK